MFRVSAVALLRGNLLQAKYVSLASQQSNIDRIDSCHLCRACLKRGMAYGQHVAAVLPAREHLLPGTRLLSIHCG